MIEDLRQKYGYPIQRMCEVFGVSRSGFYAWQCREPTARQLEEGRLEATIKAAHKRGRGTYGREKIQEELSEVDGIMVGLHRIRRIRRKLGLYCRQYKEETYEIVQPR